MIAAEPDNDTYTENLAMDLATALVKADLPVGELRVLQRETADVAASLSPVPMSSCSPTGKGTMPMRSARRSSPSWACPALLVDLKEGAVVIALCEAARDAIG